MIKTKRILAVVALTATAGTLSAARTTQDLVSRAATNLGALIGLSPEGAKLWAADAVANSDYDRFVRSTQLHRAVGEQLANDRPDRKLLSELAAQAAVEAARLERLEQDQLLRIASRLSAADRKALGRFIIRSANDELSRRKSVLQALP